MRTSYSGDKYALVAMAHRIQLQIHSHRNQNIRTLNTSREFKVLRKTVGGLALRVAPPTTAVATPVSVHRRPVYLCPPVA